jgi:hypothetical protein
LIGVGSITTTNNKIDSVLSNALNQVPKGLSAVSGVSTETTPAPEPSTPLPTDTPIAPAADN